jgi:uncharacterized membrane protein HdeD (DUF308 family)
MAVDLSPVFAIFMFVVSLYFTVNPVRKFAILNITFGMFEIMFGSMSLVFAIALPFHPWFSMLSMLLGSLCVYRGATYKGE